MRSPQGQPALSAMRARRGHRRVVGRPHLGRAAHAARDSDGCDVARGPDPAEGRHADAQLRRRADAVRPAVPRRRRRAHRAADRRQGAQSRRRRRRGAVAGADRVLPDGRRRAARRAIPTTCLRRVWKVAALLLVDDLDAASLRHATARSSGACSSPSSTTSRARSRPRPRWRRTMSGCRSSDEVTPGARRAGAGSRGVAARAGRARRNNRPRCGRTIGRPCLPADRRRRKR